MICIMEYYNNFKRFSEECQYKFITYNILGEQNLHFGQFL